MIKSMNVNPPLHHTNSSNDSSLPSHAMEDVAISDLFHQFDMTLARCLECEWLAFFNHDGSQKQCLWEMDLC